MIILRSSLFVQSPATVFPAWLYRSKTVRPKGLRPLHKSGSPRRFKSWVYQHGILPWILLPHGCRRRLWVLVSSLLLPELHWAVWKQQQAQARVQLCQRGIHRGLDMEQLQYTASKYTNVAGAGIIINMVKKWSRGSPAGRRSAEAQGLSLECGAGKGQLRNSVLTQCETASRRQSQKLVHKEAHNSGHVTTGCMDKVGTSNRAECALASENETARGSNSWYMRSIMSFPAHLTWLGRWQLN